MLVLVGGVDGRRTGLSVVGGSCLALPPIPRLVLLKSIVATAFGNTQTLQVALHSKRSHGAPSVSNQKF